MNCTTTGTASRALREALAVIANVLDAPRDRLGRVDHAESDVAREAREALRLLAVRYNTPGAKDTLERCAQVARAALRGETMHAPYYGPHETAADAYANAEARARRRTEPSAKHTPGPWTADPEGEVSVSVQGADGTVVCDVHGGVNDNDNVDLITAAPDLLAALEAFLRAPSIGSSGPGSVSIEVQTFNLNAARAAIARAKGQA